MSFLELILIPVGAPMKSGGELIAASCGVARFVSTRLHDVDFTRSRPVSILVVLREEPDCGP